MFCPNELYERYNITTVTKATYGREVQSVEDEFIVKAEQAGAILTGEDAPGATIIDLLPVCKQSASSSG